MQVRLNYAIYILVLLAGLLILSCLPGKTPNDQSLVYKAILESEKRRNNGALSIDPFTRTKNVDIELIKKNEIISRQSDAFFDNATTIFSLNDSENVLYNLDIQGVTTSKVADFWMSRIAFNNDNSIALVYVFNKSIEKSHNGAYFLLMKENRTWRIVDRLFD